jgi:hypothetical protein
MRQGEAQAFFVDRVILQATNEDVPLSGSEIHMLSWSEPDPGFTPDPGLLDQLASEMPDERYEEKIAGLLRRSFEADVTADPNAKAVWQRMRSASPRGISTFSSCSTRRWKKSTSAGGSSGGSAPRESRRPEPFAIVCPSP